MSLIKKLRNAWLVKKDSGGGYMVRFGSGIEFDVPEPGERALAYKLINNRPQLQSESATAVGLLDFDNGAQVSRVGFAKTLERCGFTGSATVSQSAAIQDAINRHEANGGGVLEFPPELAGKTIRLDTGLTIDVTKTTLIAPNITFDHSNQAAGNALTLKGDPGNINASPFKTVQNYVAGIVFKGPGTSAVGCILPEGSDTIITHKYLFGFFHCSFVGFKPYTFRLNRDCYGIVFDTCGFWPTLNSDAVIWCPNVRPDGQPMTNAGERITLINCTGLNGGKCFVIEWGNTDMHIIGCSWDQFDCTLVQLTGQVTFIGGHIENKKDNGNWFRLYGPNATMHMVGTVIYLPQGDTWDDYDIFYVDEAVRFGGAHLRDVHFSIGGQYLRQYLCGGGGRTTAFGISYLDVPTSRPPWSRRQSVLPECSVADSAALWTMQLSTAAQRGALDTIQVGMAGVKGRAAKLRVKSLGVATSSAKAGNTGNGIMSAVTVGSGAKVGTYTLTVIEPATNGGAFTIEDPDGIPLPSGSVGAAYSQGWLGFTLADGAVDFASGDQFGITVAPGASGLSTADLGATYRANSTGTQGEFRVTAIDSPTEARGDIIQPFSLATEVASYYCFSAAQSNAPTVVSVWKQPFNAGVATRVPSGLDTLTTLVSNKSIKLLHVEKVAGTWGTDASGNFYFLGGTTPGFTLNEAAQVNGQTVASIQAGGAALAGGAIRFGGAEVAAQRAEVMLDWRPEWMFTMSFLYSRTKGGGVNGKALTVTVAYLDANGATIGTTQSVFTAAAGADADMALARASAVPPPAGTKQVRVRIETGVAEQTGDVVLVGAIAIVPM